MPAFARALLARAGEPALVPGDDQFSERLRGLSAQQLLNAMMFLSFWSPSAFTAVLDYCEACNQLRNLDLIDSRERERLLGDELRRGELLEFGERFAVELDVLAAWTNCRWP